MTNDLQEFVAQVTVSSTAVAAGLVIAAVIVLSILSEIINTFIGS